MGTCPSAVPSPSQEAIGAFPWAQRAAFQMPSLAGGSALGDPRARSFAGSRAPPPCSQLYSRRGVGPPPGGPWESMMARGLALGTPVTVSTPRIDCLAPKHDLGPAPRPLSPGSLAPLARAESASGPLASAKPSDPWTESPEPLWPFGLGTLMPPPSQPRPQTHRQTRRHTGCKPGAHVWQALRLSQLWGPGTARPS